MQISDAPLTLPAAVWAAIGAAVVAIVGWIFTRAKTKADTYLSNALARKAEQETKGAELEASINAADTIMHLIEKVRTLERENNEKDRAIEEKDETIELLVNRLRGNGKAT